MYNGQVALKIDGNGTGVTSMVSGRGTVTHADGALFLVK